MKDMPMVIRENGSKMVCVISPELFPVIQLHPHTMGLPIGELKKQFILSMAGADLFARCGIRNKYYIVVNDKAANLVLYGRDIMGDSILEADMLDENEMVIILNNRSEAMGIGKTRFAGKLLFQKARITVTTITDAGYYLRDED